jgi:hypothetical protein
MEQNETKGKPVCLVNSNLTMTIDENGMPSMSFSTSWLLGLIGAGAYYRDVTQFQYFKSAKIGRKMMAWVYVYHARFINALTIKVLMYITAMEALVSTSTAELSHQVAERVAILLSADVNERLNIYNEIKKGYGVRSKAAHGEPLKGTEQDVKDLLVRLDDYMRRLMKFDTPYDLEQGDINDFFIKKLMGVPVV